MTADTPRRDLLHDLRSLPLTVVRFGVEALRWMLIAPISTGFIRLNRRHAGLLAVAGVAAVLSTTMLLVVLGATVLRERSDLSIVAVASTTLSVPRATVWLFVAGIVLFITLLQAGALHVSVLLRCAALVAVSTMLLFVGSTDTTGGMSPGVWTALAAIVTLVAFQVVRWRSGHRWWETPVVMVVVVAVFAVTYSRAGDVAAAYGIDRVPIVTESILRTFRLLSLPLTVFAGVAVAKVAVSGMSLVSDFTARRFRPSTSTVIAGAVIIARLVGVIGGWISDLRSDPGATMSMVTETAVSVAVIVGVWGVVHALLDRADRRAERATDDDAPVARSATTVERVVDHLDLVAIPAAVLIAVTTLPTFFAVLAQQIGFALAGGETVVTRAASKVADISSRTTTIRLARVGGGLLLVIAGLRFARRGRRGLAELVSAIGTVLIVVSVASFAAVAGRPTLHPEMLDRFGVVTAVAVTAFWLGRRNLSPDRLGVVMLLVLVSSLFAGRDFVSSPLTAVIGTSGVALALFGFVWTFVADAGPTGVDSPGLQRDSRLLLFLAQTSFGLTVLGWVAVTRDPTGGFDLSASSDLGDATIGTALLVTVYLTLLTGGLRRSEFVDTEVEADRVALPFAEEITAADGRC